MNSKKNYFKTILLLVLLLIIIDTLFIIKYSSDKYSNKKLSEVCFSDNCFKVEISDSKEERTKGLMNRELLDGGAGMLFVFPEEDYYSFWMKDTLISLDIIWISKDGEIVYIEKSAPPCDSDSCAVYKSNKKALYVLEINSGKSEEFNIKIGDKISFS